MPSLSILDGSYDLLMDFANLSLSVADGLARVALNRPQRRNALSLELLRELKQVLTSLGSRPDVDVIVISGEGPDFSAGHDLSEMLDREPAFHDELFATCTEVMMQLQALAQPVIAQVHGTATAAGCQLVAACDLAVADTTARFATPGVQIGLFCTTPMVPLMRSVGRKRAMQMLLTGEFIDAETAREWGLINEVVAVGQLPGRVADLAASILRFSPEVIGIGKGAFYAQAAAADASAYGTVTSIMSDSAALPVAQEGMRAFLEKRPPVWPS